MEVSINAIIVIVIAILIGVGVGILIQRRKNTKQLDNANAESKEIVNQAFSNKVASRPMVVALL